MSEDYGQEDGLPDETALARRARDGLADAAVLRVSAAAALAGALALLLLVVPGQPLLPAASLMVYALGLAATFLCSAAYNLHPPGGRREILRRLDHAAIFVMVAGSYTPFALIAIGGAGGRALFAVVWGVALLGVAVKLGLPRRFERSAVVLYLIQGWAILAMLEPLTAALSRSSLLLLLGGGLLYTLGLVFHLWRRLPYQSAVWHGFVLAGAACHYAAVLDSLVLGAAPA